MSKSTRNKPCHKIVKPNGKVTDFFQIIPSSSRSPSSSQPSSSQPSAQPKATLKQPSRATQGGLKVKKDNIPPRPDQEVISVSSGSHISISSDSVVCVPSPRVTRNRPRTVIDSVEIVSPRKTRSSTVLSISSSSEAPVKNARIPNRRDLGTKAFSREPQSSLKRKKKFESDSESDHIKSVVHVSRSSTLLNSKASSSRTPNSLPKSPSLVMPKEKHPKDSEQRSLDKPSPKKKAKVEPEQPTGSQTGEQLVPSSQSDEQELAPVRSIPKDPQETKETIEQWRRETSLVGSQPENEWSEVECNAMDVDFPINPEDTDTHEGSASIGTVRSETEVSALLQACTPSTPSSALPSALADPAPFRPFTPPSVNELPSLPPTPVAETGAAKAQAIIARIRAQAAADALDDSSDDESKVPFDFELPELSDSDADDEDGGLLDPSALGQRLPATPKSNVKSKYTATSPLTPLTTPLTSLVSSDVLTPALSSRAGSPGTIFRGKRATRASTRLSRPGPSHAPVVLTKPKDEARPRKKRDSNPLAAMLKEKTLADKRGRGMNAIRNEEEALSLGKSRMMREMDDDDDVDMDSADESDTGHAARKADRLRASLSPGLGRDIEEDSDEDILDEQDRLRLLGNKRGTAVGAILEKDRAMKGKAKETERVEEVGIEVFGGIVLRDIAEEETQLPTLTVEAEMHPLIRLLRKAICEHDVDCAKMLVTAVVCVHLDAQQLSSLLPWLCEIACSPGYGSFSDTCFQTLMNMAPCLTGEHAGSVVPMMHVSMARLGAKRMFMKIAGYVAQEVADQKPFGMVTRAEVLYRMVNIAAFLASRGAIPVEEIPSLIVMLVLIGLDSQSSPELRRRVIVAIDSAGLLWEKHPSAVPEQDLSERIIQLATDLTPVNKAHLFSLLMCGSSIISSVARFAAFAVLITANNSTIETYAAEKAKEREAKGVRELSSPPAQPLPLPTTFTSAASLQTLHTLVRLLSPPAGSGALFDMSNSDIDYDALGHFIEILGVVLSDVDIYVAEEKRCSYCAEMDESPSSSSPRKDGERRVGPLKRVRDLLDWVHGKIVDTRAAHLDRSRTKAALQRLSMRVHYQRRVAFKAGPARTGGGPVRPRTLREHWKSSS